MFESLVMWLAEHWTGAGIAAVITALTGWLGVRYGRDHKRTTGRRDDFTTLNDRMNQFQDTLISERERVSAELDECRRQCAECQAEHGAAKIQIEELQRAVADLKQR